MLIACFLVGRFHSLSLATDTHNPPGLSMDVHSLAQHRVLEQRRKLPSPLDALINHINHDMSAEDELIEERKRQAMARAEAKARRVGRDEHPAVRVDVPVTNPLFRSTVDYIMAIFRLGQISAHENGAAT